MKAPQAASTRRRWHTSSERAVTPIIGSILILVIMILAIGGIVAWGVPAIQGLQNRAEFESILTQFLQLDSDVRNLRDPQNTRISTISIAKGQLEFDKGDRWVVSGARDSDYNGVSLTGWDNAGPAWTITIAGLPGTQDAFAADEVTGGSFSSLCPMAGCTNTIALAPASLATDVVRIQAKEAGTVRYEAWIFNTGKLTYRQTTDNDLNLVHFEMGAVFSQQGEGFFIEQTPSTKDPDYTLDPKDTSLFVRMLQLTGTEASLAGKGRHPIVFNLVDNYGSARGRPSFDPATMVRLQIWGDLEVPFCNYYKALTGWTQIETAPGDEVCEDEPTNLQYLPGVNLLLYDLNHAVVTTTVKSI